MSREMDQDHYERWGLWARLSAQAAYMALAELYRIPQALYLAGVFTLAQRDKALGDADDWYDQL